MWLRELFRGQELDPCRKLTFLKPEDTERVRKLELRWLQSVEEGVQTRLRNWRPKYQDREQ